MNQKLIDICFKYIFRIVALFSVLALGAIILFVFIQGSLPFLTPTAQGIRLVPQRIDEITVNGSLYKYHSSFMYLPKDTELIQVSFPSAEGMETLNITVNKSEKDPEKALTLPTAGKSKSPTPKPMCIR